MNNGARVKLAELIQQNGPSTVHDQDRCESLLKDYCAEYRVERSALISALREGVPATLLMPPAIPHTVLLLNLSKRLQDNHPLTDEAARWAVQSWAAALGVSIEPPTGLVATAANQDVRLTWHPSAGAVSYSVKRSTVSGGPYTVIGRADSTHFVDGNLKGGTPYYFIVSAVTLLGESDHSAEAAATPRQQAAIASNLQQTASTTTSSSSGVGCLTYLGLGLFFRYGLPFLQKHLPEWAAQLYAYLGWK